MTRGHAITVLARDLLIALMLGLSAFAGYRFILFPDMTRSVTTGLRGTIFGLLMLVALVAAVRATGRSWIGVCMPFAMAIGMEYVIRHSGTNSDGLEGVGELMIVTNGLVLVFLITQAVRFRWARRS